MTMKNLLVGVKNIKRPIYIFRIYRWKIEFSSFFLGPREKRRNAVAQLKPYRTHNNSIAV